MRPDDRLRIKWKLLEKRPSSKPGRGHWLGFCELTNQNDDVALSIEARLLMTTRPEASA